METLRTYLDTFYPEWIEKIKGNECEGGGSNGREEGSLKKGGERFESYDGVKIYGETILILRREILTKSDAT